jgi:serine protease Do
VRLALLLASTLACGDATPQAHASAQARQSNDTVIAAPVPTIPAAPQDAERRRRNDSLQAQRYSAIVEAAERVAPAVVSVNVVRVERRRPRSAFDWFLMPRSAEREVPGLGSGFIVSADGIVITNQHVTADAQEIVVTTREGEDYDARLLGEDPLTDIAVLEIDGRRLPTVAVGASTDLMIGEWVVAIGNPYGYLLGNTEPSVTAGVVSAVGRNLLTSGDDRSIYVGMIQTDAAINPGNSGGPLVNALGEVVGVNSSIFSQSGGSVGIGFAIPIERALRVASELQRYGAVRRSWIGLSVAGSERLREWKRTGGLPVTDVAPESPAAAAGIERGDVLVSADGRSLRTFLDWEAAKLDVSPGESLAIAFRRDGRQQQVGIVIADLPTARAEKVDVLGDLQLITLDPAVRQERGIESEQGALIYHVGAGTQRATGLRQGDVILQINRRRVARAEDVQEIVRQAAGRGAIRVYFERNGSLGYTDFYVR